MIWLDLDGVMADFDGHYERHFGVRPASWPEPDGDKWKLISSVPNFYRTLPLMPNARDLFQFTDELGKRISPVLAKGHGTAFLTGCPASIDASKNQKIEWTAEHFPDVMTVCCRSRDKFLHGLPGDILIDDYLRYSERWIEMGGIFVHHTSVADTIRQLRELVP